MAPESDKFDHNAYNGYIQTKIWLTRNGVKKSSKVIARKKDIDNRPIGQRHANSLLDIREYIVNFTDGSSKTYAANLIAKNIYSQVNKYGRTLQLLSKITDHCTDGNAMAIDNAEYLTKSSNKKKKRTIKGGF